MKKVTVEPGGKQTLTMTSLYIPFFLFYAVYLRVVGVNTGGHKFKTPAALGIGKYLKHVTVLKSQGDITGSSMIERQGILLV